MSAFIFLILFILNIIGFTLSYNNLINIPMSVFMLLFWVFVIGLEASLRRK